MADKSKQQVKGGTGTPGGAPNVVPPATVNTPATPAAQKPVTPAPVAQGAATVPAKTPTAMELISQRLTVMEARIAEVEKVIVEGGVVGKGAPKAKFGGKRGATPTKDTATGVLYISKSACGKAVAAENGLDPNDHYVWYELIKRFPGRFVDCDAQEAAIVQAQHDAEVQASIDAVNAKIAADEAAANVANAQKK